MKKTVRPLCALLASLAFAACDNGPPAKAYQCAGPATIEIDRVLLAPYQKVGDSMQSVYGNVALPKGVETDLKLVIKDASGAECDPAMASVEFSSSAFVVSRKEVVADNMKAMRVFLTANADPFDADGQEPAAVLLIKAGAASLEWPAAGVLALAGKWHVAVENTPIMGNFEFSQTGRTITYQNREEAGQVFYNQLTLNQGTGLTLNGTVMSDRVSVSGTWRTTTDSGTWVASRVQE